jgi:hypothetical protein
LCVVGAEWRLFARPFDLAGVWIGWPKTLDMRLGAEGQPAPEDLASLARRVADLLPRE